ncbi:MAG: putative phosphoribosyltransferase regulatory subunit [Pseudomonadota bacterium]|jgi:ATP phosphoribosyltransferase regulatory subunit
MTDAAALARKALLPAGLRDLLPPDAEHEAQTVGRLMKVFHAHGYERVKPPLVEFEEALLSGPGAALAQQTFRIMDPVSQRMMGVRSDMTTQVARIAASRLGNAPRPLRLSYAGQVLRVKGTQLRPERQFGQVGAELIGADAVEADAEIVLLAAAALEAVGASGVTIDLAVPTLVPLVCRDLDLTDGQIAAVRAALDRRDPAELAAAAGPAGPALTAMMAASGPAAAALSRLSALSLPAAAAAERERLARAVALIVGAAPDLIVTIDPVEQRGFEYQTGLSFTLFARGVSGELGRGGRYLGGENGATEPATGFTLYTDTVLRAVPGPAPRRRVLLPHGTAPVDGATLRADGWQTVAALSPVADPMAEARRLSCSHVLYDGRVEQV